MRHRTPMVVWTALAAVLCPIAGAEGVQHLGFYSRSNVAICELSDPASTLPAFPGERSERFIGTVCEVRVPRSTFASYFSFCAVSYTESYVPGPQSCGVTHHKDYVTFIYSYSPVLRAPPVCEFVCVKK